MYPMLTAGIFDAITSMGSNVYSGLMKILVICGVIAAIIGIIILMVTRDDRKVSSAKGILVRVIFGIAIACALGAFVSTILSLTSSYHFDTSQTAAILSAFSIAR